MRKATSVPILICDLGTNDTDCPLPFALKQRAPVGDKHTRWAVHRPPNCTPETLSVKQGHDRPLDRKSRNSLTRDEAFEDVGGGSGGPLVPQEAP